MCLAIPAQVLEVDGQRATVAIAGNRRQVDIGLVAGVAPGQYVLVHAGVALQVMDEDEARETLDLIAAVFTYDDGGEVPFHD